MLLTKTGMRALPTNTVNGVDECFGMLDPFFMFEMNERLARSMGVFVPKEGTQDWVVRTS